MPISIAELATAAETIFSVSRWQLLGACTLPVTIRARSALAYASCLAGRSYADIAEAVGGLDTSEVGKACALARETADTDPAFRSAMDRLTDIARGWAPARPVQATAAVEAEPLIWSRFTPTTPAGVAFFSPAQLAERWGGAVTTGTLANWRSQGRGPAFAKLGSKVLYPIAQVTAWEVENLLTQSAG